MRKIKLLAVLIASAMFLGACNGAGTDDTDETTTTTTTPTTTQDATDDETVDPTDEVTEAPTDEETVEPTDDPNGEPTGEPTEDPNGEPTDEPTEDPNGEPTETEEVDFVIPELPQGDGSEVVIWNQIFEDWNQAFFEERAEEYNTLDRGYTAAQEFIPGDAWTERMQTAQATQTAPDTYIIAYNGIYSGVRDETILPLDGIFAQEQLDDILPNVREMVSFNDQVYAYPQLVEPSTVLFYRTDLFEAAGLDGPPTTWDELVEYGVLLSEGDVFGLGVSPFPEMAWNTWGWQMQAAGHLAINDNWDAPTIDEGYIELANLWKRLYEEGAVPAEPLGGYNELNVYGEGALAMKFSGSWGIAQLINDYPEMYELTAVAPPPTQDGSTDNVIATNGGWTYVIDALTDNVDGAYNYISWLLAEDPQTSADFFEIAQYSKAATRQSVAALIDSLGGVPDHATVINDIAARSIAEPTYPWDISVAVATMFENVALGGMPAEAAAEEARGIIQSLIDDQGLAGQNPAMQD